MRPIFHICIFKVDIKPVDHCLKILKRHFTAIWELCYVVSFPHCTFFKPPYSISEKRMQSGHLEKCVIGRVAKK